MGPSPKSELLFPFVVELPPPSSRWHVPARWGRAAGYVVFFAALMVVCLQFHGRTAKNLAAGENADQRYRDALADLEQNPTPDNRRRAMEAARGVAGVKRHRGAIGRWRKAVQRFWAGRNIYRAAPGAGAGDPLTGKLLPGASVPPTPTPRLGASPEEIAEGDTWLHPNMPFVAMLLTPLAHVPPQVAAAVWNVLKVLALFAAIFAASAVANHRRHRMGEWVLGLAVAFSLPLVIEDFQHGNTNVFVLAAIAVHLWLYRRGRDGWAGAVLALAISLKMTPALFGLYWLYQRNWRLLAGVVVALAGMMVLIPLAALGPGRYDLLMGSWLHNLIVPGLLKGAPYPIHVNQSLSGVFSRLFMQGNIYFAPDDEAVAQKFGYINVVSLSLVAGRLILLAAKVAIAAVLAWAIGWRKLPRDDGRRGLHYGLVVAAMLILNQRTWDHHAAILLLGYSPLWYALAYGRFGRRRRIGCLAGMIAAGVLVWGASGSLFPEKAYDLIQAYGPMFLHFVIIFILCVVLLGPLGQADRLGAEPYASRRQSL